VLEQNVKRLKRIERVLAVLIVLAAAWCVYLVIAGRIEVAPFGW
jgi:hypothetical protein